MTLTRAEARCGRLESVKPRAETRAVRSQLHTYRSGALQRHAGQGLACRHRLKCRSGGCLRLRGSAGHYSRHTRPGTAAERALSCTKLRPTLAICCITSEETSWRSSRVSGGRGATATFTRTHLRGTARRTARRGGDRVHASSHRSCGGSEIETNDVALALREHPPHKSHGENTLGAWIAVLR